MLVDFNSRTAFSPDTFGSVGEVSGVYRWSHKLWVNFLMVAYLHRQTQLYRYRILIPSSHSDEVTRHKKIIQISEENVSTCDPILHRLSFLFQQCRRGFFRFTDTWLGLALSMELWVVYIRSRHRIYISLYSHWYILKLFVIQWYSSDLIVWCLTLATRS